MLRMLQAMLFIRRQIALGLDTVTLILVCFNYIFFILVEMVTLTRENGKTITRILPMSEVDALIAEHDRLEALAEQAKKEKQKL